MKEIYAAFSKAQSEFKPIIKNKRVKVRTKSGGEYTFLYADLSTCRDAVLPSLIKHGLSVSQIIESDKDKGSFLTTILGHTSGEDIRSSVSIPEGAISDVQGFGSLLTYLRRYSLCAILGIVADDDDDGNLVAGNQFKSTPAPVKASAAPVDERAPECPTCGATMKISKAGTNWYCPNFRNITNGEHPTIKRQA